MSFGEKLVDSLNAFIPEDKKEFIKNKANEAANSGKEGADELERQLKSMAKLGTADVESVNQRIEEALKEFKKETKFVHVLDLTTKITHLITCLRKIDINPAVREEIEKTGQNVLKILKETGSKITQEVLDLSLNIVLKVESNTSQGVSEVRKTAQEIKETISKMSPDP